MGYRNLLRGNLLFALCGLAGVTACSSAPSTQAHQEAVGKTSSALVNLTAASGLHGTGVDVDGVTRLLDGANDLNYTVTSPDDVGCNGNAVAIDKDTNANIVIRAWIEPNPLPSPATWVSCAANPDGLGDAHYLYTTKFTIPPGIPASTVTVTGNWSCDNGCTIEVNGTLVDGVSKGILTAVDFNNNVPSGHISLTQFSIPTETFAAGENTITFVVYNAGNAPGPQGLLVSDITVSGGCDADDQCAANGSQYCKTDDGTCHAKIANGTDLPGGMVCPNDGLTNVCISGVCGADDKCGYDVGGPCDAAKADVCRSGKCSEAGACLPADACQTDADCNKDTEFCNANKCTPKLDNGEELQPPGTACTEDTGASICKSGACNPGDSKCGVLDKDPCANDGQCRSADSTCVDDGTGKKVCTPPKSCQADDECADDQYCNKDTNPSKCAGKVTNGDPLPGGTVCPDDAARVCASGVCDTDDSKCGMRDDGACTANSECRSNVCTGGKCASTPVPATGCTKDADCTNPAAPNCNLSTKQCEATPKNNTSNINLQGNGVFSCAVRSGAERAAGTSSALGLGAIALVGLLRRRRQQDS